MAEARAEENFGAEELAPREANAANIDAHVSQHVYRACFGPDMPVLLLIDWLCTLRLTYVSSTIQT